MKYIVLADSIVTTKGKTEVKGAEVDGKYFPEKNIPELVEQGFIKAKEEDPPPPPPLPPPPATGSTKPLKPNQN